MEISLTSGQNLRKNIIPKMSISLNNFILKMHGNPAMYDLWKRLLEISYSYAFLVQIKKTNEPYPK